MIVTSTFDGMAGKGAKKRNSKDSTGSKEKKKTSKKKNGRSAGTSAKSSKIQGDIFNEGAMENAYFICHNVQVPSNIKIEFELFALILFL